MGKDTIILSADTSSAKFSVALLKETALLDEFEAASFNRHSSGLIPAIDKLLSKNSYDINAVDVFCVGLGPGSFTGLRIGITTIRAMALALRKPIIGVPSIDGLAYNLSGHDGLICVIIDAKQNKVYARIYKCSAKIIKAQGGFLLLGIKELLNRIKEAAIFVGDGINLYHDDILRIKGKLAKFAPEVAWYPKAAIIGRLGLKKLMSGEKDNVFNLSPIYIYPKECQVKRVES